MKINIAMMMLASVGVKPFAWQYGVANNNNEALKKILPFMTVNGLVYSLPTKKLKGVCLVCKDRKNY